MRVTTWLHASSHPVLKRPYLSCPVRMVELLRSSESDGFSTYIASGGDP